MKQQRKLQLILQAIDLLRQDKTRGFRIDIETDSTIQGDREQEKAQRTEFIGEVTKFIEVSAQTSQLVPEFAPLAAKMLQFAVRGFRVGRDLESAIDDFCDKAEIDAKAKASQPPPPSPEMMKVKGDIERQQIENQGEQANNQANLQMKQMDIKIKEMDAQIAQIRANAELQANELEVQKAQREDFYHSQKHIRETERAEREHQRALELGEAQHKQKMSEASKPAANGAAH